MTRIRTAVALMALAVVGVAGCSDSQDSGPAPQPPGASQPVKQPGDQASGEPSADPSAGPSKVRDVKLGGDAFCKKLDDQQKAFETTTSDAPDAAEKAKMKAAFTTLATQAPDEIHAEMRTVADFYGKLIDGQISPTNPEAGKQFAGAVQVVQKWITKHCTGYDISIEGPGTN